MARVFPVLRIDRFASVISTCSESSVSVMRRAWRMSSSLISMGMSDCPSSPNTAHAISFNRTAFPATKGSPMRTVRTTASALTTVVVIRGTGDVTALLPRVGAIAATLDAQIAINRVGTLQQVVDDSLMPPMRLRFFVVLFAALAVTLGSVGVYGVVSYAVARRRGEFAVRLALGATPSRVRRAVLGGGVLPVTAGVALGLGPAAGVAREIAGVLYGVSPSDPVSFATAAAALFVAGALAAMAPAIRAGSGNPAEALRAE